MAVICYAAVLAALLAFPETAAAAARNALTVWGIHVVPSLFPYMVLSKLLARQLAASSIPVWIVCPVLGLLGGSPTGAAVVASYGAQLSPKASLILAALTGTISPMFFLGTASAWTGDPALCRNLLVCQYAGALLAALCVAALPMQSRRTHSASSAESASPLSQSIDAILQVGGCIMVFSVLASFLGMIPFLPKPAAAALHALLEISGGVHAIACTPLSFQTRSLMLSAVSGFGGISILVQNLFFVREAGVRGGSLALAAALRALFSCLTMLLLL